MVDHESIEEYRFWLMFDATDEKFNKVKAEYDAFIAALERENVDYSVMEDEKSRYVNEPEDDGFEEAQERYARDMAIMRSHNDDEEPRE